MFCYLVDLSLFIALWGIYNNELCATTRTEHCFFSFCLWFFLTNNMRLLFFYILQNRRFISWKEHISRVYI